jgi:nitroreductase
VLVDIEKVQLGPCRDNAGKNYKSTEQRVNIVKKKETMFFVVLLLCIGFAGVGSCGGVKHHSTEGMSLIKVTKPDIGTGMGLLKTLDLRRSTREYTTGELSPEELGWLLWSANGINAQGEDHRTTPSAYGANDITVYVALSKGLYRFDARQMQLEPVSKSDIRPMTGEQPFVKEAAVELILVSDQSSWNGKPSFEKDLFSAVSAGCVAQNVYLFCASRGLATVVRSTIDREALHKYIGLSSEQKVMVVQTVGHPLNARSGTGK